MRDRKSAMAVALCSLLLGLSGAGTAGDRRPDPLLAVDQNRAAVIDRIVDVFKPGFAPGQESAVREVLERLRADHLLAASLAPTLNGLLLVLRNGEPVPSAARDHGVTQKALGDPTADLTYTPVTPCRIVDTRLGGGGTLAAGQTRDWHASNVAGDFVNQGGSNTNCGVTIRPPAVMVNITVANTGPGPAFVTAWPSQQPRPTTSVLNWNAPGTQVGNAVILPTCVGLGCGEDFAVFASSGTDVVIDILGYFAPPSSNLAYVTNIAADGGTLFTGVTNVIGGSGANAVANGVFGATIAGGGCTAGTNCGGSNSVQASFGTVGGGMGNVARGYGTVGGGVQNSADHSASVAGGEGNSASGYLSVIGGGFANQASGSNATVPGGSGNEAAGFGSFAAGLNAKTYVAGNPSNHHDGVFVWSDWHGQTLGFHSIVSDEFAARARGGVRFVTEIDGNGNPTWTCGVSGGSGGSWGCSSDRNLKAGLVPLDGSDVLKRLATMPIYSWFAKDDLRRTPHAGPTAQDFMATFGLGDNERMIGFADAQGVMFAAIKALNEHLREKERAMEAQSQTILQMRRDLDELRSELRAK